jgi:hypothetical protein
MLSRTRGSANSFTLQTLESRLCLSGGQQGVQLMAFAGAMPQGMRIEHHENITWRNPSERASARAARAVRNFARDNAIAAAPTFNQTNDAQPQVGVLIVGGFGVRPRFVIIINNGDGVNAPMPQPPDDVSAPPPVKPNIPQPPPVKSTVQTDDAGSGVVIASKQTPPTSDATTSLTTPSVQTVAAVVDHATSAQRVVEVLDSADAAPFVTVAHVPAGALASAPAAHPIDNLWTIAPSGGETKIVATGPVVATALAPSALAATASSMVAAAAVDAMQGVPQYFEFAHLGSPLMLLADSVGNFVRESASIPMTIATADVQSQSPWLLTIGVIAADVVLLTYMHRRKKTATIRARPAFAS